MIAAGIPIPVLPPGVKRGRGRPPKSMLVVPDGPPNANLPDAVLRAAAEVDPRVAEMVKMERPRASPVRMVASRASTRAASPRREERTACVACGRVDGEDRMLLCDGCDKGYHTHCLVPRLDRIPANAWFCYECVTHDRPKTAAAEAFERRRALDAGRARETGRDERQRVSDKLKLNGERKLKPGPKPGSKRRKSLVDRDDARDGYPAAPATEKRPVGRPKKDPDAWSDEQLEALQNAQVRVDLGRKNFWTEVASYVPGKTAQQCKEHVYAGLNVDADEDDARADEDDDDDTRHHHHRERTFRTPTKPNSSRENAERWRHRAPPRA